MATNYAPPVSFQLPLTQLPISVSVTYSLHSLVERRHRQERQEHLVAVEARVAADEHANQQGPELGPERDAALRLVHPAVVGEEALERELPGEHGRQEDAAADERARGQLRVLLRHPGARHAALDQRRRAQRQVDVPVALEARHQRHRDQAAQRMAREESIQDVVLLII